MLEYPKLGFSEILGEARLFGEYLKFHGDTILNRNRQMHASNPDWRPVLLIPGFLAGDASLAPLGARLRSLGHKVFYAGIWMNAHCPRNTLDRLQKRLREANRATGRKVAIIGHSLGGVYARELARANPDIVERVFLLGSPVRSLGNTAPYLRPFVAAMRFMHGRCMPPVAESSDSSGLDLPEEAPEVPESCIYTKSDGIVEYHSCLDEGPLVECVEVSSSHMGLPLNLKTWEIISSRLSGPIPAAHPVAKPSHVDRDEHMVARRIPRRIRPSHLKLVARKPGRAA